MTATSGKYYGVGLRYAVAFALNSNGRPNGTNAVAYEGLQFAGAKAFTLTPPASRRIAHPGDDVVKAVDFLPPQEGVSGELRSGRGDFALDALLSGVLTFAVGEATMIARSTDQQGDEPHVGLLLYQQALDGVNRLRRWHYILVPKTRCIPMSGNLDENVAEMRYEIAPVPVSAHLWGVTLALNVEGAEEAAYFEGMSEYKPKLVAFEGDNATLVFPFPTAAQAASTDKISVFVNGVLVSAGITKATTGVTWSAAPASGADINIFYEVA